MEVVILLVISVLLVVILFIAIKKLTDSLEISSKEYYFNKIKEYDDKIDEKVKSKKDIIDEEEIIIRDKKELEKEIDSTLLKLLNLTDYSDIKYFKLNKSLKENFNIDEAKIINDFLTSVKIDDQNNIYQDIIDKFSPNMVFSLKSLSKDMQVKKLESMFSEDEKSILNKYLENHVFNLKKFMLYITDCNKKSKNIIEVLVDDKNKNYDNLSPYIKTIYSNKIYKGIIIKYQNKLYDYSINERDVV